MAEDEKHKQVQAVASAVVGSVAVVAAALNPATGAAAAAVALAAAAAGPVAGRLGSIISRAVIGEANQRYSIWLADVAFALNYRDAEDLAASIEKNIDEKWARESHLEGFRHVLSALDEEAIPIIAAISADHIGAKVSPTSFHRRAAELAARLDSDLLASLSELLEELISRQAQWSKASELNFVVSRPEAGSEGIVTLDRRDNPELPFSPDGRERELFHALKLVGLGSEPPTGTYDSPPGGPDTIDIPTDNIVRMSKFFKKELIRASHRRAASTDD